MTNTYAVKYAILLTASIITTTTNMGKGIRTAQYAWSVKQWCEHAQNKSRVYALVFVENTGSDVGIIEDSAKKCRYYEVVKAPQIRKGCKGHLEMDAISYAFRKSTLLKQSQRIIKITGRYFVPQLFGHLSGNWMALRQHSLLPGMRDSVHCEIVGAHRSVFLQLFSSKTSLCHVEKVYESRFRALANVSKVVPAHQFPHSNHVVKRLPPLTAKVLPGGRYIAEMPL